MKKRSIVGERKKEMGTINPYSRNLSIFLLRKHIKKRRGDGNITGKSPKGKNATKGPLRRRKFNNVGRKKIRLLAGQIKRK